MTRWLDEDEQRTWRAWIAASQHVTQTLEAQLQSDAGIPHAYYEILVRLSEAPGRTLRMSELADALQHSRSRLSHAVSRLESDGWVARRDCPSDRRGQLATLTERGLAELTAIAPGHVEAVRAALFAGLTREQQHALRSAAEAIVAHAEAPRRD